MNNIPKLRYKGFEKVISPVRLVDVVNFRNGKGHEQYITEVGKYVVVNSKFISSNRKVKKYSNNILSPLYEGDLVMVMSDVPNGKAIAKFDIIDKNDKYTLNQRVGAFSTLQDNKYLFYKLNRNKYFLSFDDGVKQTNLKKEDILTFNFLLPDLQEQKRISNLLSEIDILINEKEKETNNINILRNYHLKEKFHSIIGNSKMQDIMILKNGRDYKHCSKGNVPVYGTGGFMTKIDQSLSTIDAIGIGRKGTIDNPFILRAPFWTVDTLFYAIPKNVPLYYLYLQFQSINWKQYNEGSTLPSLTSKSINNVKIHLHTQNEISHISNLFENFDKLLLISNNELKYYYEIKKFLLTKMLV